MRILLLLVVVVVSVSGCTPVMKTLYGIKNPKIETRESILSYSSKIKMDTALVVTLDTAMYLNTFVRIGKSVPEAELYDKRGTNITYRQKEQDCNAGLFGFLPELKKDSVYRRKDNFTLERQLASLRDLNGNKINLDTTGAPDYYLFLYWVRWMGRLNKDHVMEWEALAKSNKNVKIKVIKVNLDFQDWWSDPYEQKVLTAMGGKK